MPVLRAMSMTTGIISAATATLFMMADMAPAEIMITATSSVSLRPERRNTTRPIILATPVRVSPPLRINTAHTVTTAGLLNPESASAGVVSPVKATAPSTSSAVTSMGIHSVTRKRTATLNIVSTDSMSAVIRLPPLSRFGAVADFPKRCRMKGADPPAAKHGGGIHRFLRRECPRP